MSLSSIEETPLFPTIIVLFLLRRVSQSARAFGALSHCFPHRSPIERVPKWIPWGCRCPRRFLGFHIVAFDIFGKHLTHHGSRGLLCGFLMLVSGAVEPHVQFLAWHAATSSLWFVTLSTALSTASSRLCDKLPLFLVLTCSRSVVCR